MGPLMMTDAELLDFEEGHPTPGPRKDAAIYASGEKPVRYAQRLNHLRVQASALETHPALVHRLERQAQQRRLLRSERRVA